MNFEPSQMCMIRAGSNPIRRAQVASAATGSSASTIFPRRRATPLSGPFPSIATIPSAITKRTGTVAPHRAFAQALAQALALQQLGDDVRRAVVLADMKDRNNVGMVQRGSGLGFLFKASKTLRVTRPVFGQYLDRYVAFQRGVACAIHFAHSARTQGRDDLIRIEAGTRGEWHSWGGLYLDSLVLKLIAVDLRLAPVRRWLRANRN